MKLLAIAILALPLFANSYTTSFPATENPISQGGNWYNGAADGTNWCNVQTTPALAFGTCINGGPPYNDSSAGLKGTWGSTQMAQATVYSVSQTDANDEEVELRLRQTITAGSITGYEITFRCTSDGSQYMAIVRWNGPLNSFTTLTLVDPGGPGIHNGDVIMATAIGSVITAYVNGGVVMTATDSTYSGGSPGMGFWDQGGTTGQLSNFGFSYYTAYDSTSLPWLGVLDPGRAPITWSNVGVPGGIPARTTICSTLTSSATTTTINAAIQACPANETVLLGAGTYSITAGIGFATKSNVTLRGSGANSTFLVMTGNNTCHGTSAGVCMDSNDTNYAGAPSNTANWTAGYAKGSNVITLSSTTNLGLGSPITLDQTDDTVDSGNIFICYTPAGTCSTNGDNGGAPRAGRSQQQIVTVTSISGTTVGITPPIYMPNWASGKSPQAWWATTPIIGAGLENMSIDYTSSGAITGVEFFNCDGCWVKGIRSIGPTSRSHVMAWQSARCTVQDNYFYKTNTNASDNYGVEAFPASDMLVQNNIFMQIQAPYPSNGSCSGCVFAYNFDVNNTFDAGGGVFTFENQSGFTHSVGDDNILYEGNQGSGFYADDFHGTHNLITLFRNAYNGNQPNNGTAVTNGIGAFIALALSRFYNVIGNVLGAAGYLHYENTLANPQTANTSVIAYGGGDGVPDDTNVARTLMLWGNYDTVTATPRWCGNSSSPGWSTTCASTSEVPSGISIYANPVPLSTALPSSFYLTAKPNWWPSAKPWPAIGPDVTGGNIPNVGGYAYTIPAADCYKNVMGGNTNGTGSVLAFNPGSCYATPTFTGSAFGGNQARGGNASVF